MVDKPRGSLPWGFYPKSFEMPWCRLLSQSGQVSCAYVFELFDQFFVSS